MGSRAAGAEVLGVMELSPAWWREQHFQPRAPPADLALGRKKVFPVHLLTQSSWGDLEVGWQPAVVQRPAWAIPCPHEECVDPPSLALLRISSTMGQLTRVRARGDNRLMWTGAVLAKTALRVAQWEWDDCR